MTFSASACFVHRAGFIAAFTNVNWIWLLLLTGLVILVAGIYEYRISKIRKRYLELQEQILQRTNELKTKEIQLSKTNSMQSGLLKDLWESKRRLKQINDNKDKLFSIVSHDLKSPFNSLLGFSDLMLKELDNLSRDEIKDYVFSINKSVCNVYGLLENLLEWSRIQTGRIDYLPVRVVLSTLVNEVFSVLEGNAVKKNIKLINQISADICASADINMIRSVISNLVSNAIKFTGNGGEITVMAAQTEDFLEVSVSDNGIGMSKEQLAKLFRTDINFSQNGTENEKGTGLGLVLCRELIEKNGGRIAVESFEGKGTTFVFTLPKYCEKIKPGENLLSA